MKRYAFALLLLLVSFSAVCKEGSDRKTGKISFAYDVDFEMNFDNREYDASSFSRSSTIFGARLSPVIGISFHERRGGRHRLMLGVDVMKDFGASPISPETAGGKDTDETSPALNNRRLFREILLYYNYIFTSGRTDIGITAGIFPRRFMKGEYSAAFFSDSLKFYDNNIEGLLMSFTRPSAYYELGCDWMGMYGTDRRERFMVFSSGHAALTDVFSLGYAAYLYHFAGAKNVSGVVDNALVNPFIGFDASDAAGLQRLDFRLGWLQSFQNDRRNVGKYVFPHGGEFTATVRNWNVGVENYLFYGTGMMPYYNSRDVAGLKYGNLLYMGDPFYRVSLTGGGTGFYDRVQVFYEPRISDFLSIRVAALLHFNEWSFSGWQQQVSLRFNLQALLGRR